MIDVEGLAERPRSEVEWEELLVKLDIAPRALRAAAEDAGAETPSLRDLLARAASREGWWSNALEALRAGLPLPAVGRDPEAAPGAAADLLAAFEHLRGRNFARVQRRGLVVWEWRSAPAPAAVTGYQALQAMQREDARTLAALRALARG